MPRMRWTVLLGALLLWAQWVSAVEPLLPASNCPCRAAPAYALSPGCCEPHRHCFDNAWDGYCAERARWDTFWCKLGTGALYPSTPCATRNDRGAALEIRLRPAAAACGCRGSAAVVPAPQNGKD